MFVQALSRPNMVGIKLPKLLPAFSGMLSKELLSSIGFKDLFCPICAETGGKNHEAHKDRVKNF